MVATAQQLFGLVQRLSKRKTFSIGFIVETVISARQNARKQTVLVSQIVFGLYVDCETSKKCVLKP